MADHDDQMTLGEVGRAIKRLEGAVQALSTQMTVALGPVGELRVHVENCKKDIDELATTGRTLSGRVDVIELRAAGVAGAVSALILLGKFLLGK